MAEKVEFSIGVQMFSGGSGFDLTPIYAEARNLLGVGPDDPIIVKVVGGSPSTMFVVFDDITTSSSQETDCPAGPATISGSLTFTPENKQFTFSGTAAIVKTVEVVEEPPGDPRVFTTCGYSFETTILGNFPALFEEAVANQNNERTADFIVAGNPVFGGAQGSARIPLDFTAKGAKAKILRGTVRAEGDPGDSGDDNVVLDRGTTIEYSVVTTEDLKGGTVTSHASSVRLSGALKGRDRPAGVPAPRVVNALGIGAGETSASPNGAAQSCGGLCRPVGAL